MASKKPAFGSSATPPTLFFSSQLERFEDARHEVAFLPAHRQARVAAKALERVHRLFSHRARGGEGRPVHRAAAGRRLGFLGRASALAGGLT